MTHRPRSSTGRRVLVVDDDEDVRTLIRTTLEIAGFTVVGESTNGASAVSDAWKLDPDFITMDVHLPYRSGFSAAEFIGEIRPRAQIVVISGTVEEVQPEWAKVFLPKSKIGDLPRLLEELAIEE